MATLKFKMLHITVNDNEAWELLADYHRLGWRIEWESYSHGQYHFLLVGDDAG